MCCTFFIASNESESADDEKEKPPRKKEKGGRPKKASKRASKELKVRFDIIINEEEIGPKEGAKKTVFFVFSFNYTN